MGQAGNFSMELGTSLRLLCHQRSKRGGFAMPEMIEMRDASGKLVSGSFKVREGVITVTASDGRTKTANLDESLLNRETLARSLLLLLQNEKQRTRSPHL
jgi:hypothetical protein